MSAVAGRGPGRAAASVPAAVRWSSSSRATARSRSSLRAERGITWRRPSSAAAGSSPPVYSSSRQCALAPPKPKELTPARRGGTVPSVAAGACQGWVSRTT